jgi:hypothetical protein
VSAKKDITAMVRKLVKQGWNAYVARNGHWRLTSPEGRQMTCSQSPRTNIALIKARADARALGADL